MVRFLFILSLSFVHLTPYHWVRILIQFQSHLKVTRSSVMNCLFLLLYFAKYISFLFVRLSGTPQRRRNRETTTLCPTRYRQCGFPMFPVSRAICMLFDFAILMRRGLHFRQRDPEVGNVQQQQQKRATSELKVLFFFSFSVLPHC